MKTILVAEDDPELRKVVAAVLRNEGYRVLEASDPYCFTQLQRSADLGVPKFPTHEPDMKSMYLRRERR